MYPDLKGKIALVTGASKGIGAAIALELAKNGCVVMINFNRSLEDARKVLEEARKYTPQSEIIKCDVSRKEDVENMFQQISQKHKKLDVLVNNAGINKDRTLKNMTYEEWDSVINTNLQSVFYTTKNALPLLHEKSSVINISSIVGINGNFGQCNYSASKAAVIGFTKSLARELGKNKIRVNAIAPGLVETEMTKDIPFIQRNIMINQIPMKRFGLPEEIAKLAAFLSSEESSYITGEAIRIDGGFNF